MEFYVLDLDGTLVEWIPIEELPIEIEEKQQYCIYMDGGYLFFRQGLNNIFNYIKMNRSGCCIWTSASKCYAIKISNILKEHFDIEFDFILSCDNCKYEQNQLIKKREDLIEKLEKRDGKWFGLENNIKSLSIMKMWYLHKDDIKLIDDSKQQFIIGKWKGWLSETIFPIDIE